MLRTRETETEREKQRDRDTEREHSRGSLGISNSNSQSLSTYCVLDALLKLSFISQNILRVCVMVSVESQLGEI